VEVLSVGELTRQLKGTLESGFPAVWVEGELSNVSRPGSGHWYFTLKDARASLSVAMFRGDNSRVRFDPEHGMSVLCHGRISVYPPRGNYQLIADQLEPQGVGALQAAFEQLRKRLAAEGLFEDEHKQDLPFMPVRIGLVTSPSGAAIRDMLRVLTERFEPLEILVAPTRVQGEGAEHEIAAALDLLQRDGRAQVILCGRGGGSLEDLWAFNTEVVARAIAACTIPVISAVGHEVDVTIADMVADVRAATPSNAAEIAVPVRAELDAALEGLVERLAGAADRDLRRQRQQLRRLREHLVDPRRYVEIQAQRRDELEARLAGASARLLASRTDALAGLEARLAAAAPGKQIERARQALGAAEAGLARAQQHRVEVLRGALGQLGGRLDAMSPLAVLGRGYAIASTGRGVLRSAGEVASGDRVDVRLGEGRLDCTVDAVHPREEER